MSTLDQLLCKAWNGLHMHVGLTARCEHVFFLPGIRACWCWQGRFLRWGLLRCADALCTKDFIWHLWRHKPCGGRDPLGVAALGLHSVEGSSLVRHSVVSNACSFHAACHFVITHDLKAPWRQSFECQGQFFAEAVYLHLQQHPARCEFQSLKEAVRWGNSGPHGHCPTPEGQCPQLSTWLLFPVFHWCSWSTHSFEAMWWISMSLWKCHRVCIYKLRCSLPALAIFEQSFGNISKHWTRLWCPFVREKSGKSNTTMWNPRMEIFRMNNGFTRNEVKASYAKDVATIRRFCESLDGMLLKRMVFAHLCGSSFGMSGLPA